jgi:hypothetical protein
LFCRSICQVYEARLRAAACAGACRPWTALRRWPRSHKPLSASRSLLQSSAYVPSNRCSDLRKRPMFTTFLTVSARFHGDGSRESAQVPLLFSRRIRFRSRITLLGGDISRTAMVRGARAPGGLGRHCGGRHALHAALSSQIPSPGRRPRSQYIAPRFLRRAGANVSDGFSWYTLNFLEGLLAFSQWKSEAITGL